MLLFRWILCTFLLSLALSLPTHAQQRVTLFVAGPPDLLGNQIREKFVDALAKQRIAVVAAVEGADLKLGFYILAAKQEKGVKVAYILDVTDPSRKLLKRFTGEEIAATDVAGDVWTAVTPAFGAAIATKATASFADWVQAGGAATKAGVFAAFVPPVTGAPGDGQASLTAAIRRALQARGVTLVDQAFPKAHRIEGSVRLGTARAGKQAIGIEWVVKNPRGARIGRVNQNNEIAAGSLYGAWGNVAEWAGTAAALRILEVLERKGTR